jgi:hypothetical protein
LAASLVDHLWQSVLTLAILAAGAFVARGHAAIVRLWMWRIAGLKFLLPYRILFVIGEWLGFPIKYADDTVPAGITEPLASVAPFFMPAQSREGGGWSLAAAGALLLVALIPCARLILEQVRLEFSRASREFARAQLDADDVPRGLGFLRGLGFAAVTMVALGSPVLAGAVHDRIDRHDLLLADSRSLFDSEVVMRPAAPGMGQRVQVSARAGGVFIRNATIQDLAAFAYGVNRFFVRGDHFYEEGERDWLIHERYDIRIDGVIRNPDRFDTYALRVPVTRMLAKHHGLEIYVNSACQPPCGRYDVAIPRQPP